jgi:hypothetical protein
MSAEFDFHMRGVDRDRDPYYYTNWDNAIPLVIRATNRREAVNKADAAMGPCRSGRYWVFKVDRIEAAS